MSTTTGFYKDNTGYVIDKDPDAVLSYQLDWSEYLQSGVEISTSSWTIETISGDSDPLTLDNDTNTQQLFQAAQKATFTKYTIL